MKKAFIWSVVLGAPVLLALCMFFGSAGIGLPSPDMQNGTAILKLRFYRIMAGFIVGAGLACAGAVLQALLRNPLAEPYVLGVSSGAGLGAAFAILTGIAAIGSYVLPGISFICAILTLALVYSLAKAGGRLSLYSLILSGVVVSAVCGSLLMFLVAVAPVEGLHSVIWWMLGSLDVSDPFLSAICAALIGIGAVLVWLMSNELNALSLGRETAHNVGVRTEPAMTAGLAFATLMASAAVAASGLIGFVGLIIPHTVRNILGPDHRRLIPVTFIVGGVFLAVCDAIARTILIPLSAPLGLDPIEVPVGVITALIGGPFFLVVLYGRRKQGWVE